MRRLPCGGLGATSGKYMREAIKTTAADPLVGKVFGGKYTIDRLIGRGGVGLVYLADQQGSDEPVVLKLLAPGWIQNQEAVSRFEREAKRLGGVRHPNIVRMHDYGHQDGRAYLVMEFLEGELLSDFVSSQPRLALEDFVPIAAQILKGMGHAHSRELMVRDIKPANIMLCSRKGRANFVKILDFGLAKLLKDEHPVTEEHVLGTVGYLAPEAIRGEDVDLRVDVYALGVLFYYMLAGRLPFEGSDSAAVFYKTINEAAPRLDGLLPADHAPKGLIELIHRCLEKDPDDRPADANAIVEELIDVVPASMFRLPKLKQPEPGSPLPMAGFGNTGLVELVGQGAVSGRHAALANQGAPRAESGPITLPPVDTITTGPFAVTEKAGTGMMAGALVVGALLAVLGGGAVAYMFMGGDDPSETAAATPPPAPVAGTGGVDLERVEQQIADAVALIDAGKFDDADDALDQVRGVVADSPPLQGSLARADRNLMIGRLMAAGATFEKDGDIAAAVGAYRDVLEADATHVEARSSLSRLTARAEGESEESDVAYGPMEIRSKPLGYLYIDGEAQGTTPFSGKLPVGKHTIRVSARGYQAWQSEWMVAADKNDPIKIRLSGRGKGHRGGSGTPEPADSTPPVPTATPEPKPVPATKKPEPTPSKKKKNVFLPTSDDKGQNGGGVFLPTKD